MSRNFFSANMIQYTHATVMYQHSTALIVICLVSWASQQSCEQNSNGDGATKLVLESSPYPPQSSSLFKSNYRVC